MLFPSVNIQQGSAILGGQSGRSGFKPSLEKFPSSHSYAALRQDGQLAGGMTSI